MHDSDLYIDTITAANFNNGLIKLVAVSQDLSDISNASSAAKRREEIKTNYKKH